MKAFAKILVTTIAFSTMIASVSYAQRPSREGGGQELGGTSRNGGPGTPVGSDGGSGSSSGGGSGSWGGGSSDHGSSSGGDGGWGGSRPDRDSSSGSSWGSGSSWNSGSWTDSNTSWSRDRYRGHRGHGRHDRRSSTTSSSYVYCAPEVVNSNVKATDKTLIALTKTSKFASAKKFNASIAKISSLKNPNQKAAAYLDMVGIDAGDAKAVVAFVGSREARGSWLIDLQRNTDLSEKQAEQVAVALQTTLRGGLQ